jgi:hypothetical protein
MTGQLGKSCYASMLKYTKDNFFFYDGGKLEYLQYLVTPQNTNHEDITSSLSPQSTNHEDITSSLFDLKTPLPQQIFIPGWSCLRKTRGCTSGFSSQSGSANI